MTGPFVKIGTKLCSEMNFISTFALNFDVAVCLILAARSSYSGMTTIADPSADCRKTASDSIDGGHVPPHGFMVKLLMMIYRAIHS